VRKVEIVDKVAVKHVNLASAMALYAENICIIVGMIDDATAGEKMCLADPMTMFHLLD
jgi:hypothetical protein